MRSTGVQAPTSGIPAAQCVPEKTYPYQYIIDISALYIYQIGPALKDVVTPYTHISEASRYILYTIILTFDDICTIS